MTLNNATFDYFKPTDEQAECMRQARIAAKAYADTLEVLLPDGADKTFVMRSLRTVAMWANTAISRLDDGSPR